MRPMLRPDAVRILRALAVAALLLGIQAPAGAAIPTAGHSSETDPIRINFQLAGGQIPCGYTADTGRIYGNYNGLNYGWNKSHADVTRDRNANADQRLDTLAHFHQGGVWEIAVPNGNHTVTVSIGDPSYASVHTLNAEGSAFWQSVSLTPNRFLTETRTVSVADGRLTLDQGSAFDKKTRINYIEINAPGEACPSGTAPPAPQPTAAPPSTPTPTTPKSPTPAPTPRPTVSPTPPAPGAPVRDEEILVNFQPQGSAKVCGYLPDHGKTFGDRDQQRYGWNLDHTDTARDRGLKESQLLDTLNHFKRGSVWEVAVKNGIHRVRVSIGDAGYGSTHSIYVEGRNYWDDAYLAAGEFRRREQQVTVTDGRLTIGQGDAADMATRINFVAINSDGEKTVCAEPSRSGGSQNNGGSGSKDNVPTTGGSGTVGARPSGLRGLMNMFGKPCNTRSNNARSYFPSAGGRGKHGYVYYHSKLAKKVGGKVLGAVKRSGRQAAVDYGVWGYACRKKTGGTSWSVHSWGAAIDTNTLRNPWRARNWDGRGSNGRKYGRYLPNLYLRQNFYWGIHFRDPMHFQYVSGY